MTPREFANLSKGIYEKRTNDYKNHWEQTRSLMFSVSAPHLKNKNSKPTDILKFPWENSIDEIDLNKEIAAVEIQKNYWQKIDEKRQAVN